MKAIDRDSAVESVKNLYEFASEWAYERGMCDVVESLRCDRDEVEAVIEKAFLDLEAIRLGQSAATFESRTSA